MMGHAVIKTVANRLSFAADDSSLGHHKRAFVIKHQGRHAELFGLEAPSSLW
jgi:hypothetical protein